MIIFSFKKIDINSLEKNLHVKEVEIERAKILNKIPMKHIIVDCSCVNFIDMMGVNGLIQVRFIQVFLCVILSVLFIFLISFVSFKLSEYFKKFDIKLHLSCIKHKVFGTIKSIDEAKKLDINMFYPTNADAVESIQIEQKELIID